MHASFPPPLLHKEVIQSHPWLFGPAPCPPTTHDMGSAAGDGIHSVLPLDLLFPRPFSHVHYLHLLRTSSKDRARFPVPFHVLVLVISAPGYLYSGVTFPGCRCSPAFAMLCCLRLPLLFTPVPTVPAADGRSLPAHMHCANRVKPWPHRTVKDPPPLSISPL